MILNPEEKVPFAAQMIFAFPVPAPVTFVIVMPEEEETGVPALL
jgi:hypothetical protein